MNISNAISKTYHIPEPIKLKVVKNEDLRKFCVIPLRAALDKRVTGTQLRVLAILASYCNKGGFSFVSLSKIAQDLKCSHQNISKHLKKLEALNIIQSFNNSWPGLKGNTRRIIYDDKIKKDDLKEFNFENKDISAIRKHTKLVNKIDKSMQPEAIARSSYSDNEDIASLLEYIARESDLITLEKLINQGKPISELKSLLSQGIQISDITL